MEVTTQARLKSIMGQHKAIVEERRRALSRLEGIREEIKDAKGQIQTAVRQLDGHKTILSSNTKHRLRVHFDRYMLEKELAQLKTKCSKHKSFFSDCVALSKEQQDEVDRLQALAEAARVQISDAKRDIEATSKEAEKLSNRLQSTEDDVSKTSARIKTQDHCEYVCMQF